MNIKRFKDQAPGLNLTPMIDVVFLLIVFFLVATTFYREELDLTVELPEANQANVDTKDQDEIIIHVRRDGTILFRGEEILSDESLRSSLRKAAQRDADRPVVIRGDGRAKHERIVQIMDACASAQLTRIHIGVVPIGEHTK